MVTSGVAAGVGSDATIRNENADSGISNGHKLIVSYSGCYAHDDLASSGVACIGTFCKAEANSSWSNFPPPQMVFVDTSTSTQFVEGSLPAASDEVIAKSKLFNY